MSPLNWILTMTIVMIMFQQINTMTYFNKQNKNLNPKKKKIKMTKKNWLW
nr:ATP synthase F0 subunit 8 [Gergithoides gibbosus]WQB38494.1 ATP synthase F0 subunit 8 [Gergithoides gibbosus]